MKGARPQRLAVVVIATALLGFALLSWFAVRTKSATYDEPLHTVSGYVAWHDEDFRVDPESPALWKYWLFVGRAPTTFKPDLTSPLWTDLLHKPWLNWAWATHSLFQLPGNDADAFLFPARARMLLLALALGALIVLWTYRLAGPRAALFAALLFSLDPNFIGHAALAKNDVALALCTTAFAYALFQLGRHFTAWRLLAAAVFFGIGLNVKFSILLLAPAAALLLLVRALLPNSWPIHRHPIGRRPAKLAIAAGSFVFILLVGFVIIWTTYRFRFLPTPDPTIHLDTAALLQQITLHGGNPNRLSIHLTLFAERHHLLPQPWLYGLLQIYDNTLARPAYLLGKLRPTGCWYYFPLVALFKIPVATLTVALAAPFILLPRLRRRSLWPTLAFAIPFLAYAAISLTSALNIGLRHVFPLYALALIAAAVALQKVWQTNRRVGPAVITALFIALAAESLHAYPNDIAFFNAIANGPRGGLHLLADSNLDWGQDLPALADWQRAHPQTPLYLAYFGTADPGYYNIRYTNLPGTYPFGPPPHWPTTPGVIAISATYLQGLYLSDADRPAYTRFRQRAPVAVLGGSIYLYQYP